MPDERQKTGEQLTAEAGVEGFKQALGPFVAAVEATRMPMMFMDARGGRHSIIFVNQAFLNLTGYEEAEVLGQTFHGMMERGADPEMLAEIRTAFAGGRDLSPVVRYRRKGGAAVWVSLYITPVRDERGEVIQHFASFVDVTQHKNEEDRLRSLLARLSERTQATLSTVLAITYATSGGLDDGDVTTLRGSILSLSEADRLLENTSNRIILGDLVRQLLTPKGVDDRHASRIITHGAEIILLPKTAVILAVFLQQLAADAEKYGALSDGSGTINLSWKIGAEHLRLKWEENGGQVGIPKPTAYGARLIERGLAEELGGSVRFDHEAGDLVCELIMPLGGVATDSGTGKGSVRGLE